jgi:hypothetical protein
MQVSRRSFVALLTAAGMASAIPPSLMALAPEQQVLFQGEDFDLLAKYIFQRFKAALPRTSYPKQMTHSTKWLSVRWMFTGDDVNRMEHNVLAAVYALAESCAEFKTFSHTHPKVGKEIGGDVAYAGDEQSHIYLRVIRYYDFQHNDMKFDISVFGTKG